MPFYRFFGDDDDATHISITTSINENVSAGDVVRSKVVEKADDSGVQAVGVAMETGTIGNSIEVLYQGTQQVNFVDSLTSSDIGKRVYVSATSGQATITPPTAAGKTIIQLGFLRNTNGTCYVNPLTILKL
jgi:hypothetical protein